MKLTDLVVGDPVKVFDVNGRHIGQPEGGWDGTVVHIGRKLITVEYGPHRKKFRLDSGTVNDKYEHQHILTVSEAAFNRRYRHAVETLYAHGVDVLWRARLSLAQVEELASVVTRAK